MRKLNKSEIDFRVGMIKKTGEKVWCTLLAYKDARVDMAMLDDEFGQMYWQNEYKRDSKGVLQCGIGVYDAENKHWVWKWSNGTESQTEAQKGEYSDAFKRAGFMWGIGRELYDVPTLFVTMNKDEYYEQGGKVKQSNSFQPNKWNWEITDKHIKATHNGVQRVYAKYDDVEPNKAVKQELKPKTEKWEKAVKYLVDGGVISDIEGKYALSEVNKQLLQDEVLK